jgi:hypothetical protein
MVLIDPSALLSLGRIFIIGIGTSILSKSVVSAEQRCAGLTAAVRRRRSDRRPDYKDSKNPNNASSGLYRPGRVLVDATRANAFSFNRMSAWI